MIFSDSGGSQAATAALPVSTGTWYLITGVWDSSANNLYLYVNGALQATTNTGANIPGTGSGWPLVIGSALGSAYMAGSLDDVRVYSRALSSDDVRKLYNVGYYTCASPSGHRGDLVYSGGASRHVLQYCDGATWRAAGPSPGTGGGGCLNPAGTEGHILYNGDFKVMQYCDGAVWRQIGPKLPVPTATGLVGYWKMDEGTGTTTADSSGNGNTGTLTNSPTWTIIGRDADALVFNGSNSQLVGMGDPAALRLSGSWTISAWVNLLSLPGSGNVVVLAGKDGSSGNTNYQIDADNGQIAAGLGWIVSFNTAAGGANHYAKYVTSISTGTWYHVAGVYDSTAHTLTLYLNGTSVATSSVTGFSPNSTSGGNMDIGAEGSGSGQFNTSGTLDDVRVYNRALTAQEVSDLYHGT